MKRNNVVTLFLLIICIWLFYPAEVFAQFDFSSIFSDSGWEINNNGGLVTIDNNNLVLKNTISPTNNFPYVRTTSHFFPISDNQNINIIFKYLNLGGFGDGINITFSQPQGNLIDITGKESEYYLFAIWQDANLGASIFTWMQNSDNSQGSYPAKIATINNSTDYHTLNIQYNNGIYKLQLDGLDIFTSAKNSNTPYGLAIGNSIKTRTLNSWNNLEIKDINFISNSKTPVVIIPGLGASWDFAAMYSGLDGNNWSIPSFVKNYNSLIKSFENEGYVRDTDLFVFAYDWRKPVDYNSDKLDAFIKAKIGSDKKVNIVGHSMGGLVARDYAQKYGLDNINKIITLGSPFKGAVDAYAVWEGTTVWDDFWWGKLAVESMIHLTQENYPNRVIALRSQAPSFENLLPVFDYISKDGSVISWSSMKQKNNFLGDFDLKLSGVQNSISAILGKSDQTKSLVKVEDRSLKDSLFGLWEDGKPIENNPFDYVDGDGTVTLFSAGGGLNNKSEFPINHIGLPSNKEVIESIFDSLGLDKTKVEIVDSKKDSDVFAVFLRSPGKLKVCNSDNTICDSNLGIYLASEKMFFIPGYSNQDLNISVEEDGTGSYHLHVADIDSEANWEVVEGEISSSGQVDSYQVFGSTNKFRLGIERDTNKRLLQKCKRLINDENADWDSSNHMESLANSTVSIVDRLRSARILQQIFGNLLRQKYIDKNYAGVVKIFSCWGRVNDEIASILKTNSVDEYYLHLDVTGKFLKKIMDRVNANVNIYSLLAFNKAEKLLNDSSILAAKNKKLGVELSRSVDQMLLASYGMN